MLFWLGKSYQPQRPREPKIYKSDDDDDDDDDDIVRDVLSAKTVVTREPGREGSHYCRRRRRRHHGSRVAVAPRRMLHYAVSSKASHKPSSRIEGDQRDGDQHRADGYMGHDKISIKFRSKRQKIL